MRLAHRVFAASLILLFFPVFVPALSAAPGGAPLVDVRSEGVFPDPWVVDSRLRKNLDFWIGIYTKYDTSQGAVHDAKYIDHVYEILNGDTSARAVRASKSRWTAVLLSLHHKQHEPGGVNVLALTPDERKVYDLFSDVDEPDKFLAAAHRKRLRFQLGQKNRMLEGLRYSGRYLPEMEAIFKSAGLPTQLTRLPFVESGFNIHALSKVGASGVWQFMRSTGKLFLEVDGAVDERNDPIRATEAAAKLLKLNFESLRDWGLAVTAYNHGRKGMMRAVREVGSNEIGDVVHTYRSSSFGFAGSNYFTCLLAAIVVERDSEKYFGKIERDPPLRYFEVRIPDFISLPKLAAFLKLDPGGLKELNPGLSVEVLRGRLLVPAGYRLRLPRAPGEGILADGAETRIFLAGYSEIPGIYKFHRQRSGDE